MTTKLKNYLMIALKIAVNSALMAIIDMVHEPSLYNFHTKVGLTGITYSIGKGIAVREAVVWGPILLNWSKTNADPSPVQQVTPIPVPSITASQPKP